MPEAEPQKEIYETPDQEDGKPALASSDRKNLEDENTTISKVAQKKERQQQKVNDEIEKMLTEAATGEDANRNDVQNLREESEHLKRRMKFGESPEQILIELAQIKKRRAREKVDEKAQAEKEKEELDINYPLLQKQIKRWDDICNKNTHLIGGGQKGADGNKAWFRQELAKNPTIKFAKQKIDEFDGTIPHPEGLAPRRKNFQELEQLCKKYSFGSPLKSAYIKENGKDEREAFLKEAKEA
ncbi:MAG: hypothetical protein GWP15_03785, partial [Nitrospirae bacterium]|nr:hypothetical protein [Nitrospirota bacterium]